MLIKNINLILIFCWVIILSICGILFSTLIGANNDKNEEVFYCGNSIYNNTMGVSGSIDTLTLDGKALFMANCASCHHPIKDATGPPLHDITAYRSPDWIYNFLTDPNFQAADERANNLRTKYNFTCLKFPDLTPTEVEAILVYSNL